MKVITVQSLLESFSSVFTQAQLDEFSRLAKLTALRDFGNGAEISNYWRGPLLYELVRKHKPRNVLEFGTGRGYGSLCMALAADDAGFECDIWTIDFLSPKQRRSWLWDEGTGPIVEIITLEEAWKVIPARVVGRIHPLTGFSFDVMKQWRQKGYPQIDFCFIDGGHDYWTAKHDFVSALSIGNPGCPFLLDDYNEHYGVKAFVDRCLVPQCNSDECVCIDTGLDPSRGSADLKHCMVYIDGRKCESSFAKLVDSSFKLASTRAIAVLMGKVGLPIWGWVSQKKEVIAQLGKV